MNTLKKIHLLSVLKKKKNKNKKTNKKKKQKVICIY